MKLGTERTKGHQARVPGRAFNRSPGCTGGMRRRSAEVIDELGQGG